MKEPRDILYIGEYQQLVATRAELLRSYGYDVVEASNLDRAVEELTSQEFSATVLCQSLSANHCLRLAEIIKDIAPSTVVVVLGHVVEEADVNLDTPLDPQAFLNSIGAIAPTKSGAVAFKKSVAEATTPDNSWADEESSA
jgi:CheY-like chemotaxis protein